MKYTSTFLWLSAALLSAAPADKTLNLSIYDTTSTSFLNRAFTVSGNNGKVLGISGGDWALVTASGSSSLTSTQIAYGDGSNVQTSEAAFAYNSTLNILSVDAIRLASAGVGLSTNGDGALVIDGLGNGFDESIKMDFDTYSNIVQTSSPLTGVTIMDYLDMSLRVTDSGGNFATLGPSGITVHNSAWAGNYTLDFGGTDGANEEIASKEWVNAQGFGGTLTSTYVGYGSGANALTGESAFNYTAASDLLTVPNLYASTAIELGHASANTLTASGGVLSIEGVAVKTTRTGVLRTIYVNAGAMIPRTTNGALAGTTETTTNDIMYDSLAFDTTTEEGVGFWVTLPTSWNAGTLTAKFHWTATSSTGTVKWDIAARGFTDDDALDQALGTEQTASADTLLATGDMHVTASTPALTVGGTAAANRPIYFQVARDVAGDTLAADALLLGVTLEYTESSTEPSAQ